ncbi:hypothetical protein [Anthocerotibacter panamensis]|uniref:hypothetical protein n=1 Tax=Anthocerotibacter panamensis TaxID=2857077 RepID=UPI001C401F37|nr:hypothetical protein [Anthocerotibacter panamensis]
MVRESSLPDVQEPITSAPPEVRQLIDRVLKAEGEKIDYQAPRLMEDILGYIKDVVK